MAIFKKITNVRAPYKKVKIVRWKVIAGDNNLDFYQSYDLLFDSEDFKIRQMKPPIE